MPEMPIRLCTSGSLFPHIHHAYHALLVVSVPKMSTTLPPANPLHADINATPFEMVRDPVCLVPVMVSAVDVPVAAVPDEHLVSPVIELAERGEMIRSGRWCDGEAADGACGD